MYGFGLPTYRTVHYLYIHAEPLGHQSGSRRSHTRDIEAKSFPAESLNVHNNDTARRVCSPQYPGISDKKRLHSPAKIGNRL